MLFIGILEEDGVHHVFLSSEDPDTVSSEEFDKNSIEFVCNPIAKRDRVAAEAEVSRLRNVLVASGVAVTAK